MTTSLMQRPLPNNTQHTQKTAMIWQNLNPWLTAQATTCCCQDLRIKLCIQHKKERCISTSVRNSISASNPFSKSRSCSFGRCSNSWDPRDCWGRSSGNSLITSYGSEKSNLVLNRMCYKSHQPHTLQMYTCTNTHVHAHV